MSDMSDEKPSVGSQEHHTPCAEATLLPYQAATDLGPGPILVLAPHPDDEVFGCGGAVARCAGQGTVICVVIVTDGGHGGDAAYAARRREESKAAAQVLGLPEPVFWNLQDRQVCYGEDLVTRIVTALEAQGSRLCVAPSPAEVHPDHRALALAAAEAARRCGVRLAMYEVGVPLWPNLLVDITPVQALKAQAVRCFVSQLAQQDYLHQVQGLDAFRSYTLGAGVAAAEAFCVVEPKMLQRWGGLPWDAPWLRPMERSPIPGPLVSVVVRSIGRPTLGKALASLAAQTHEALEIIVVHGGSPEELPVDVGGRTLEVVIVPQGSSRTRTGNLGLQQARGSLVGFLDDDDWLAPDHVAALVRAFADNPGTQVAYGGVACVHVQGETIEHLHDYDQPFSDERLLVSNFIPMHAALFERSFAMRHQVALDESLEVYEDWDLWLQLRAAGAVFTHVPGIRAFYRIGGGSGFAMRADSEVVRRGEGALLRKWQARWSEHDLVKLLHMARTKSAHEQLVAMYQALEGYVRSLESGLHEQRIALDGWRLAHQAQQRLVQDQDRTIGGHVRHIELLQLKVTAVEQSLAAVEQQRALIEQQRVLFQQACAAYEHSTSWRLTGPLRKVSGVLRRFIGMAASRTTQQTLTEAPPEEPPAPAPNAADRHIATPDATASPAPDTMAVLERASFHAWLEDNQHLQVPAHEEVEVSIVLVLFNQAALTWRCLRSILETVHLPHELILVDNASTDETGLLLQRIEGAQVLRNAENLHFLRAANQGARAARGKYLLFLNNDTLLAPGALAAALETIQQEDRAGAVGARIVRFDGLLQEAGNIVLADGSCVGYGRGDHPEKSEYQFRRAVDYVSGCFLLTSRALFHSLGGFDEAFAPAYYEESDYCLRLAAAGHRVLYEPRAVLFHKEYGSSDAAQATALMEKNHALFVARHRERLAHHPAPGTDSLWARHHPEQRQRVLFIEDAIPHLDRGAGLPRANAIARGLIELGCFVTFYPTAEHQQQTWAEVYADLPREMEVMRDCNRDTLTAFLSSRAGYYDVVMVSRPHNMHLFKQALAAVPHFLGKARLVYDAEALFARREIAWECLQGRGVSEEEAQRRIAAEVALTQGTHCVTAVCEEEAELLRHGAVEEVVVLGHALQAEPTATPWEERSGMLFVGRLDDPGSPNWDSVTYFARHVLPLVRRMLGLPCKLTVLGDPGVGLAMELAGEDVMVAGRVADITPYTAAARIFIAPTRYAAGIPHKVHQAAALGLPVVASNMLATSLGWRDGVELLAADPMNPEAFATQCVRLYQDKALWQTVRDNALQAVTQDCNPTTFLAALHTALGMVGEPGGDAS